LVQTVEKEHLALRREVEEHYDTLVTGYALLWGEHLHHGYWDGPPPPVPQSAAQERLIAELAAYARIPRGGRLLDIGCGLGGSVRWLTRNVGCRAAGVSISEKQLRDARRRGPAGACWIRADAAALPLRDASFDTAWIVECSEHLLDRPAFFRECFRVVRPGGRIALAAWLRAPGAPGALIEPVEKEFLIAPLLTPGACVAVLAEAGWHEPEWRDVTAAVTPTWDLCLEAVRHPMIATLLRLQPEPVRRFVAAFPDIRRAYAEDAMQYGFFTAARPGRSLQSDAGPRPSLCPLTPADPF
jgi:tocopherol O-methyltransferase